MQRAWPARVRICFTVTHSSTDGMPCLDIPLGAMDPQMPSWGKSGYVRRPKSSVTHPGTHIWWWTQSHRCMLAPAGAKPSLHLFPAPPTQTSSGPP